MPDKGVLELLESLIPDKASGPDGIPARVLKECAVPLAPVLTEFFQQSIDLEQVPEDWKQPPSSRRAQRATLPITGR